MARSKFYRRSGGLVVIVVDSDSFRAGILDRAGWWWEKVDLEVRQGPARANQARASATKRTRGRTRAHDARGTDDDDVSSGRWWATDPARPTKRPCFRLLSPPSTTIVLVGLAGASLTRSCRWWPTPPGPAATCPRAGLAGPDPHVSTLTPRLPVSSCPTALPDWRVE